MKKIFVFCLLLASCEFHCSFSQESNVLDAGRTVPFCPVPEGVRQIEPVCDFGYNPICQKIINQGVKDGETSCVCRKF